MREVCLGINLLLVGNQKDEQFLNLLHDEDHSQGIRSTVGPNLPVLHLQWSSDLLSLNSILISRQNLYFGMRPAVCKATVYICFQDSYRSSVQWRPLRLTTKSFLLSILTFGREEGTCEMVKLSLSPSLSRPTHALLC